MLDFNHRSCLWLVTCFSLFYIMFFFLFFVFFFFHNYYHLRYYLFPLFHQTPVFNHIQREENGGPETTLHSAAAEMQRALQGLS